MQAIFAAPEDLDDWMALVRKVSWNFPGLETEAELEAHRKTVWKFISDQRALCVKDADRIVGVLLFSRKCSMICCLAVDPEYRRRGIASAMLEKALGALDRSREITVTTFRENDAKGTAPRRLYKKYGFVEGELVEEFGYPSQRFLLRPVLQGEN